MEKQPYSKEYSRLHIAKRTMTYIVYVLLLAVAFITIATLIFLTAERSSDLYILASEGMKARASYAITGVADKTGESDLTDYFQKSFIEEDEVINTDSYHNFTISSMSYDLDIEKISVFPWSTTATVTAVESCTMKGAVDPGLIEDGKTSADYPIPEWPTVRYEIEFMNQDDRWKITDVVVTSTNPVTEIPGTPDLEQSILPMATPTPTVEVVELG